MMTTDAKDEKQKLTGNLPETKRAKLWADVVPLSWKPFVQLSRIDLFAGSLMIWWPCTWGLTLVAQKIDLHPIAYIQQLSIFMVWSILLHSVGSTWNDICDMDYDRLVERTKKRPLPSGAVTPTAAFLFLIPQTLILIGIVNYFNVSTLYLGLVELFFWTAIYPFTKRFTSWPQVWLGIALTWGTPIAWAANAPPDWHILSVLLAAGTCWTTYADTIYAMLDKKDDPSAGVKSTALLFGEYARVMLAIFASLFIGGLVIAGVMTEQGIPYFILGVGGAALHLVWQIATVDFEDSASCIQKFGSNGGQLGYFLFGGLVSNYAMTYVQKHGLAL